MNKQLGRHAFFFADDQGTRDLSKVIHILQSRAYRVVRNHAKRGRTEGLDDKVPWSDDQRAAVITLAGRANRNVEVGSYEVDPEGGPLTFKTALDVEGDRLSVELFRTLVGTAIVAANVMSPLLADVLAGGSPLAAGAQV